MSKGCILPLTCSGPTLPLQKYRQTEAVPPAEGGAPASPFSRSPRPAVDPFEVHKAYLSRAPWNLDCAASPWKRVMSYAWVIFLCAASHPATHESATKWGHAFLRAFKAPYLKHVLPLFDQPHVKPSLDRILTSLEHTYTEISGLHNFRAIIDLLVRCYSILETSAILNVCCAESIPPGYSLRSTGKSKLSLDRRYGSADNARAKQDLPSFMPDPPNCPPAVWDKLREDLQQPSNFLQIPLTGTQRYVTFTRLKGTQANKNRRDLTTCIPSRGDNSESVSVGAMTGQQARNRRSLWAENAQSCFNDFRASTSYAGLSHQLRKFYMALKESATAVQGDQGNWQRGLAFLVGLHTL